MTIRSVSLHAHKRLCDYSTLYSIPQAFGDGHLTQSHTVTVRCPSKEGEPSLFTPLTSCAHAGRLGCEDLDARLLDDLRGKANPVQSPNRFNDILFAYHHHVLQICRTESMIPLSDWKPPQTGNTCSTVSAIVASWSNIDPMTKMHFGVSAFIDL